MKASKIAEPTRSRLRSSIDSGKRAAALRPPRYGVAWADRPRAAATASTMETPALGSGRPLDATTRNFFEPRFGTDFGDVRIHNDPVAHASARTVGALAYTVGRDIVFGAGQFDAHSNQGRRLLAHELTHVVQQRGREPMIQRMLECPRRLLANDPVPQGWKPYFGNPAVFHCGFRGILENRRPTRADPMNECFYDHSGGLVDESHPYAGCRGTPDYYDSETESWDHVWNDPGGIAHAGFPAFVASRVHDLEPAIQLVSAMMTIGNAIRSGIGEAILLGVLTATASVDSTNWRFQGLPARSVRHLNVVGWVYSSITLSQNLDTLLQNLTRRLDGSPVAALLPDIAQDVTQALQSRGNTQTVTVAQLGHLNLYQLVEWLREQGILAYVRPPEDIARERLAEARRASATP